MFNGSMEDFQSSRISSTLMARSSYVNRELAKPGIASVLAKKQLKIADTQI